MSPEEFISLVSFLISCVALVASILAARGARQALREVDDAYVSIREIRKRFP